MSTVVPMNFNNRNPDVSRMVKNKRANIAAAVGRLDGVAEKGFGDNLGLADMVRKAKLHSQAPDALLGDPKDKLDKKAKELGCSDDDLNLADAAAVNARYTGTLSDADKKKKDALLARLSILALFNLIREMQKYGLWMEHIKYASLHADAEGGHPGVTDGRSTGLSVDDLRTLDAAAKHLTTAKPDEINIDGVSYGKNETGSYEFIFEDADPSYKQVADVINAVAATGGNSIKVNCLRQSNKDISQYEALCHKGLVHIFNAGIPMRMEVAKPNFLARKKPDAYFGLQHRAARIEERYSAISAAMPNDPISASQPGLRLAETFIKLNMVEHQEFFVKEFIKDLGPDRAAHIQGMVSHLLTIGDVKSLTKLYKMVNESSYGKQINMAEMINNALQQVSQKANDTETNNLLDNLFDVSFASRAQQVFGFYDKRMHSHDLRAGCIANLSESKIVAYAKHLAGLSVDNTQQAAVRAGMVLAHVARDAQREAFVEAYLEEQFKLVCKERNFDPKNPGTDLNAYKDAYAAALDAAQANTAEMLSGAREYAARNGYALPMDRVLKARDAIEAAAAKKADTAAGDIAGEFPRFRHPDNLQQFKDSRAAAMQQTAPFENVAARAAEFADTYQPQAFHRAAPGV